jgi:hypothetical protein
MEVGIIFDDPDDDELEDDFDNELEDVKMSVMFSPNRLGGKADFHGRRSRQRVFQV